MSVNLASVAIRVARVVVDNTETIALKVAEIAVAIGFLASVILGTIEFIAFLYKRTIRTVNRM